MKKYVLVLTMLGFFILALQNCKPDPKLTTTPTDADSLYVGTPYVFKDVYPLWPPFRFPTVRNPYADSLTYEGVELGRRLFYDKHLSSTGQLACASCHKQQYAFSDAGNTKSTNVFGPTKRNSPSIVNMLWVDHLFWDGRSNTPADQAKDAFHGELNMMPSTAIAYLQTDSTYTRLFRKAFGRPGTITEDKIYKAVQQFVLTLVSSESKFDSVQRSQASFTASEQRGFQIFLSETGDCFHCHSDGSSNTFTDKLFRNNGLDSVPVGGSFTDNGRGDITGNADDNGHFRDMTLRNIALTGPYMHDGRFATLADVVHFYSEGEKMSPTVDAFMLKPNHANGGLHLSASDQQALIDFLNTLTDTKFTTNPAFSDPF